MFSDESRKRPRVVSAKLTSDKRVRIQAQCTVCPSWLFAIRQTQQQQKISSFVGDGQIASSDASSIEKQLADELLLNPMPQWERAFLRQFRDINQVCVLLCGYN